MRRPTTTLCSRVVGAVAVALAILASSSTSAVGSSPQGGERLAAATVRKAAVRKAAVRKQAVRKSAKRCVPTPRKRCPKPKAAAPAPARSSALGDGSRYSYMALDGGRPVRWDPCQPIHYVVNPTFAPPSGLADLDRALQLITASTGLEFENDGLTADFPTRANLKDRPHAPDRWAPVLIAWVTPETSDLVEPGGAGMGGAAWAGFPGEMTFITGQVAIDAAAARRVSAGFGTDGTHGALLLHELGHLIGLGHASDPEQLMYPTIGAAGTFGPGDAAGLEALGAKQGCKPAPLPF